MLKRVQQYDADHRKSTQDEISARRAAKATGQIFVPAQPKVAFVIRIRGINKLDPRSVRILRLLRLRQLHNGAFVRINKATTNLLRRVEPYITFGYIYFNSVIQPEKQSENLSIKEGMVKLTTKEYL